jgi:hypothetical protein
MKNPLDGKDSRIPNSDVYSQLKYIFIFYICTRHWKKISDLVLLRTSNICNEIKTRTLKSRETIPSNQHLTITVHPMSSAAKN